MCVACSVFVLVCVCECGVSVFVCLICGLLCDGVWFGCSLYVYVLV